MSPYLMVVLAALLPIGFVIARDPTVSTIRAVIGTIAATWLFVTVALVWLLPDPSVIYTFYLFVLVIVPALGVPVAALIATRLTGARGQLVSAVLLGVLGWVAGIVVLILIEMSVAALLPRYTWSFAQLLMLPAVYAALAAVIASRLGRTAVRSRDA